MNRFYYLRVFLFAFLASCVVGENNAWSLTQKAQEIYKGYQKSVYQIQIIDISSNEKSVIGSGFKISKEGLIATNYHVISDVVEKPDRYQIEYHQDGKSIGKLSIKTLDVAHDLAILEGDKTDGPILLLGSSKMSKGDRVFPMGNPLDLGMTIIEGTYNGLVGDEHYQHILLSASLNGGMSGGPAFDSNGNVVGVNVSIEGNALSNLVPIEYLKALVENLATDPGSKDWNKVIQEQMLNKFKHVIGQIEKTAWTYEKFGSLRFPHSVGANSIKCWGKSKSEDIKDTRFFSFGYKWCQSENNIYLSSDLRTGTIGYSITRLESEIWGSLEFYEKYSGEFAKSHFYPSADEQDMHEFDCRSHFVKLAKRDWKGVYCGRQYKKFPKLHDVYLTFAALGEPKQGYVIRVGLAGIDEKFSAMFLSKFLGGIEWSE